MTDDNRAAPESVTISESFEVVKTFVGPSDDALWPLQYRRMRRSLTRLIAFAEGERPSYSGDPDEATDALMHFFQDAFHLKDWIKTTPRSARPPATCSSTSSSVVVTT